MKKFGLIGGALIVGVVGAFASVASAQQAAPAAQQAAPNAPRKATRPGRGAVPLNERPNSNSASRKPTRRATAS